LTFDLNYKILIPITNNLQPPTANRQLLLVMDSLFTGGAEYSTLLWMEWLEEKGYKVKLILLKLKTPSYQIEDFKISKDKVQQLLPGGNYSKFKQLKKIIEDFKPDVVHSVLNTSNFLTRAIKLSGGKFKHIESVVNQPYTPERLLDNRIASWKIQLLKLYDRLTQVRGVNHFHANSRAVADHYIQYVGVPANKITVIPRGRTENKYVQQRSALRAHYAQEFNINPDAVWLINTGRHEYQKAHDVLIEAVSELKIDITFEVLIAGREGANTDMLKSLVSKHPLKNKIYFLGHRTDIPQLLAASDIFVFPSRYEGMPGALIEACAASLPAICTDLPCMHEVVDEESSLFFPINDSEALAHQINTLLSNSNFRKQMGNVALKLFEEKFQLERIHGRMEEVVCLA
jgi:glycosyltransferase involved in cell wall biosynthesis